MTTVTAFMANRALRCIALKVASEKPGRYKLVGVAAPDDRSDPWITSYPNKVVVKFNSELDWVSHLTLTPSGFTPGTLLTNCHECTVEAP